MRQLQKATLARAKKLEAFEAQLIAARAPITTRITLSGYPRCFILHANRLSR